MARLAGAVTGLGMASLNAASYVVNNNLQSGPGSLAEAISQANDGIVDTIVIQSDVGTISPDAQYVINANVTIMGNGATIDMGQRDRAFFVAGGEVSLFNLTIKDGQARGGNGVNGGGGGAGLGGALFVANGQGIWGSGVTLETHVTLSGIQFLSNSAQGGDGAAGSNQNFDFPTGGGGGMGGNGGSGYLLGIWQNGGAGGGGGGFGEGADGGAGQATTGSAGGNGAFTGGSPGGAGYTTGQSGPGGLYGGGGGGGQADNQLAGSGGGGGGIAGGDATSYNGANGGWGGGGGGSFGNGGNGGFGGGGGAGPNLGGNGGFGGGGGYAPYSGPTSNATQGPGTGGFGGGNAYGGEELNSPGGGGGGLGAGGAIFIQSGATLTISDEATFLQNYVVGGQTSGGG